MKKIFIVVDLFREPVAVFSTGKKAFDYINTELTDPCSDEEEYEIWDFVIDKPVRPTTPARAG